MANSSGNSVGEVQFYSIVVDDSHQRQVEFWYWDISFSYTINIMHQKQNHIQDTTHPTLIDSHSSNLNIPISHPLPPEREFGQGVSVPPTTRRILSGFSSGFNYRHSKTPSCPPARRVPSGSFPPIQSPLGRDTPDRSAASTSGRIGGRLG